MSRFPLGIVSGQSQFLADAVTFDGTNDTLRRTSNLTGITSGKLATVSAWIHLNGTDNDFQRIFSAYDNPYFTGFLLHLDNNKIRFAFNDGGGATPTAAFSIDSTNTYTATGNWIHVLGSVDMDNQSVSKLYINDLDETNFVAWNGGTTIGFSGVTEWSFSDVSGSTTFALDGGLAEFYFTDEHIDITQVANRRKFITASGRPAFLGTDGSLPTGTQPRVYMSGDATVWNAGTNSGSGGNFTMTGSVTNSANEPVEL